MSHWGFLVRLPPGESSRTSPRCHRSNSELITPGDAEIDPVAAFAKTSRAALREYVEVRARLVDSSSEIGSVVPEPGRANGHAIHKHIPEVPLTQQDSIAAELTPASAQGEPAGFIVALKMLAEQYRAGRG